MLKKSISVVLVLVMMLSVFTIVPNSYSAKEKDTITVFFCPAEWTGNRYFSAYYICYSEQPIDSADAEYWPGELMEFAGIDKDNNVFFKYEIPSNCRYVLFNNGVKKNRPIYSTLVQAETPSLIVPEGFNEIAYKLDDFEVTGLFDYLFFTEAVSVPKFNKYYFSTNYVIDKAVPLEKASIISVSKEKGNLEGDTYNKNQNIRFESEDESILSIDFCSSTSSIAEVTGHAYGICKLNFYIGNYLVASDDIAVLMPFEEMKDSFPDIISDNKSINTLKNAIKIPRDILDHYSAKDYIRVAAMTMLGEDFGIKTASKEYKGVLYDGRTRGQEALYKTTIALLTEYYQVDTTFIDVSGKVFDYSSAVGSVISICKGAKNSDQLKMILKKALPEIFNVTGNQVGKLVDELSDISSIAGDIVAIAEVCVTALTMAFFDKQSIKELMKLFPKSSYVYEGFNLIYQDMNKDPIGYILSQYCSDTAIDKVSSLFAEIFIKIDSSNTLKVANSIGKTLSWIYQQLGGTTIEDFYLCLYSHRVASELFEIMNNQNEEEYARAVFSLCVSAADIALDNGISAAGNDKEFKDLKNKAKNYKKLLTKITFDSYLINCQKEIDISIDKYEQFSSTVEDLLNNKLQYISSKLNEYAPTGVSDGYTTDEDVSAEDTTSLIIPADYKGVPLYGIAEDGFSGLSGYEYIYLPDSIVDIKNGAFRNCTASTIVMGSKVETIGAGAFAGCTQLSDIILSERLTSIGNNSFEGCVSLNELTVGKNVASVGEEAFKNCSSLEQIYFENPYVSISENAFEGCSDSLVIYGYEGSDAEAIANTKGFVFESLGKLLKSAEIETPATKTEFFYGDEIDTDGLTLRVTKDDGTTEILNEGFSVSFDSTAIGAQKAVVHCYNITLEYDITVSDVLLENFVSDDFFDLFVGSSKELEIDFEPANARNTDYTLTSSDESIVQVADNVLFGKAVGTAEVTVSSENGSVSKTVEVNVSDHLSVSKADTYTFSALEVDSDGYYQFTSDKVQPLHIRILDADEDIECISAAGSYSFYLTADEIYLLEAVIESDDEDDYVLTMGRNSKLDALMPYQSKHPYAENTSEEWTIHEENAKSLSLTFSESTYTEENYDYISVLNKDGELLGQYSGNSLAGKSFKIFGDTAVIRLTADSAVSFYGFSLIDVSASYEEETASESESLHPYANNLDKEWVICRNGADELLLTFSEDTITESDCDFIEIYNKTGEMIGSYSGNELSGEQLSVTGDTVIIKLVSNESIVDYGFTLSKIDAVFRDVNIESEHPYPDDCDERQTVFREGAKRLALTFSEDTETEDGYDYIYLYDKDDNEIGKYSGTELAGKTVFVPGDTAVIRLTSDGSSNYYGYFIEKVTPYYEDCRHANTDIFDMEDPTCVDKGYSGDLKCLDCGELLQKGHVLPATGEHTYEDGFCTACGKIDSDAAERIRLNSSVNFTLGFLENDKKVYRFIPDTDLVAQLDVDNSVILITLYDSDMNEIEMGYLYGNNGMRLKHHFKANKPYYFLLERNYDCGESSDFKAKATLTKLPDNLMQIGETKTLKADKDDTQLYFTFVPDEDTAVIIHTDSSKVSYGYLWDYDENWMGNGDNIENGCDIISYVKAGRRYLGFLSLDEDCSGESADVSLNTYEMDQLTVGQTLTVHHNTNDLYDYVMFTPKNDGYYRISPVGRVYNSDMMPVGTGNFFKGKAGEKYITVLRTTADTISFSYDVTAEQIQPDTIAVGQTVELTTHGKEAFKYLLFSSVKDATLTCKVIGLEDVNIELYDENMQYLEPDDKTYETEPSISFRAESGKDYVICIYTPGEESEFKVQLIDEGSDGSYLLGDADGNGEIEVTDATFIQRFVADIPTPYSNEQLMCGDVDDSGDLTIMDVTAIQYYLCHLKTPYKIGDPVS